MFSNRQIKSYFRTIERFIKLKSNRQRIYLTREVAKQIPSTAGVYVIFEGKDIVYVGETGCLQRRIIDLGETRNHQFRRTLGAVRFSGILCFRRANARRKFPSHIERKVDKWIKEKCQIVVVPLNLGRKEFEEHIVREYRPKYNQKGQRGHP